jgi:hypothetical protein
MNAARRSIGFLLLAALASAAAVTVAAPGPAEPQSMIQKTGTIDGWRLDMQGVLTLRLRHGQEFAWYSTSPDKGLDRNVEDMLMNVIVVSELTDDPLVVAITAKAERSLDGSSIEKALPLVTIGRP